MPIKLAAMDLDDTLLDPNLTLSERSIKAVRAASLAGIIMTFATNRSFLASKPFLEPLGISGLLITYGGAQTRDAETGLVVHELLIDRTIVAEVLAFAAGHGLYAHVQRDDDVLYPKSCIWPDKYAAYVKYAGRECPELPDSPIDASKLMILGEPEAITRLEVALSQEPREQPNKK